MNIPMYPLEAEKSEKTVEDRFDEKYRPQHRIGDLLDLFENIEKHIRGTIGISK